MATIKLIVSGPMGAGKTTAIRAISQIATISTEVANTDPSECAKAETTVAMDYGEVTLGNGETLHLYGTPGQERFDFMWRVLAQEALGALILLDNSRPAPLDDLRLYLQAFASLVERGRALVVVGRLDQHPRPGLDDYLDWLDEHGWSVPVFPGDVRVRDDVLGALETLFQYIELSAPDEPDAIQDEWTRFLGLPAETTP